MTQRRGFTLVEVLLALVIMGVVTGAIYRLLNTNQRLAAGPGRAGEPAVQRAHRLADRAQRAARAEHRARLGRWHRNDVTVADADGITYRAMRGLGFLCQAAGATSCASRLDLVGRP